MVKAETIRAAVNGDSDALFSIIEHYRPYMKVCSKRWYFDKCGNEKKFVDEDMVKELECKLLYEIVYHFDPNRILN